jgi:hypothetical protein
MHLFVFLELGVPFLMSPVTAICIAHLIILYSDILIIILLDEKWAYKLRSSLLRNVCCLPVCSGLFHTNILHNIYL